MFGYLIVKLFKLGINLLILLFLTKRIIFKCLHDFFEIDLVGFCFQGLRHPEGKLEIVKVFELGFGEKLYF